MTPIRRTGVRLVDNPLAGPNSLEHERKIAVTVNMKESPLEWWRACGDIDEAQHAAGERFRAAYERVEIGGGRAFDWMRPFVDCISGDDPDTDARRKAVVILSDAHKLLGADAYALSRSVLGERIFPKDLGRGNQRHARNAGEVVRASLTKLARHWGLVGRRY